MTVVAYNNIGWIISQELFFKNLYSKVQYQNEYRSYVFNPVFYNIKEPYKKKKCRNITKPGCDSNEVDLVGNSYKIIHELFQSVQLNNNRMDDEGNSAKSSADEFYLQHTRHPKKMPFIGGNHGVMPLVIKIEEELYVVPNNCLFYCDDIKNIKDHITDKEFDFILLDPPWWNKYIRRKRKKNSDLGYSMLYDKDLEGIPINSLLCNSGLIAIWCTNAPSHINAILSVLFPSWGISYVSQWFWIKVTQLGEPICEFSQPLGKQPYERIIFGVKMNSKRLHLNPEKDRIIMSVPSSIHSQKPPLSDVLSSYLPKNPKSLELFSRYLLPNYTSYGNEVLKLQHLHLYVEPKDRSESESCKFSPFLLIS